MKVTRIAAAVISSAAVLLLAGPAWAGTIRYDIQPSDQFTVTDNDTGIAKIVWNGCLVVGQSGTINFNVVVNSTQGGQASWRVLQDSGPIVNGTFTPNPVTLTQDKEQTIPTTLSFNVSAPSGSAVDFRAKLDAQSGEGLGEGPGIMVRVPCVVAAGSPPPASTSPAAQPAASCIQVTRVRLRAKQRQAVKVQIKRNGQTIQGALVRLTGPGFRTQKQSGGNGRVQFVVQPKAAGEVVIQTNVCGGSQRLQVLGARAAGRRLPAFTG
jgi:hypothetical protein